MKYFLYPILYLIAILPLPVIGLLSHLMAFIMGQLLGYRRQTILSNLKKVFPDKTDDEIRKIKKAFYINYARVFFETIKILGISQKKLGKRIDIIQDENFEQLLHEPKGALLLTGHLGNFEWAGQLLGHIFSHPIYAAYRTFGTKTWESIMQDIRARFNTSFVPANKILKKILEHKESGIYIIFLNDQSPTFGKDHVWVDFLNQDTMFFVAPEKIARKYKLPVYFLDMWRTSEGKYKVRARLITQNPGELKDGQVIENYAHLLGEAIKAHPEGWLWSHKRWKKKKENDPDFKPDQATSL